MALNLVSKHKGLDEEFKSKRGHKHIKSDISDLRENGGTATINSGSTSVTITHGVPFTPSAQEITLVFTESPTNDPGNWWVSGITATQFVVNVRSNPGASNLDLAWAVRKL